MCIIESLSPRELQVVHCVAAGMTNTETADRLGISNRTVQAHVAVAMRKTATRSRTALAVLAVIRELVDIEDFGADCPCGSRN